jgi:protein involved in polysaccharide export with SLBB domain
LQQFGYDTFGVGTQVTITQVGNVQDSYVLGPGDQISVVLRGHDMSSYVVPSTATGESSFRTISRSWLQAAPSVRSARIWPIRSRTMRFRRALTSHLRAAARFPFS